MVEAKRLIQMIKLLYNNIEQAKQFNHIEEEEEKKEKNLIQITNNRQILS